MATPAENVEVVRSIYAAFERKDLKGILRHLHEDVSWIVPDMRNVPFSGWRVGRDEVADFFDVLAEQQRNLAFAIDRLLADEQTVAAIGSYTWHVKYTGKEFTLDWVHLFTLERGLVTEFKEIFDPRPVIAAYE